LEAVRGLKFAHDQAREILGIIVQSSTATQARHHLPPGPISDRQIDPLTREVPNVHPPQMDAGRLYRWIFYGSAHLGR
jgi:hypothetical protein